MKFPLSPLREGDDLKETETPIEAEHASMQPNQPMNVEGKRTTGEDQLIDV